MKKKEENPVQNQNGDFAKIQLEVEKRASQEKKRNRIVGSAIGIPALVFVVTYAAMTLFYASHFQMHTTINGVDVSNLSVKGASKKIETTYSEYRLRVEGRSPQNPKIKTTLGVIVGGDIGLNVRNYDTLVSFYHERQMPFFWFTNFFGGRSDFDTRTGTSMDKDALKTVLSSWEAFQPNMTVAPESAYISDYDAETNSYVIVPEKVGTVLSKTAEKAIIAAIEDGMEVIDLAGERNFYVSPGRTADDVKLTNAVEILNKYVSTKIVLDWNGRKVEVDGSVIHQWVGIDDTDTPYLREDAIREFVRKTAATCDRDGFSTDLDTTYNIIHTAVLRGESNEFMQKIPQMSSRSTEE